MFNYLKRFFKAIIIGSAENNINDDNRIWQVIRSIVIIGFLMILCICAGNLLKNDQESQSILLYYSGAVGLLVLIGGASFMSGGLMGFLFGIPRIMQNHKDETSNGASIAHNDNLVEVSDWLTKIIVGVSLTQINSIPSALKSFGEYIRDNSPTIGLTVNSSISVIIYFAITGFAASYLWTRLYFTKLLANTNKDLNQLLLHKEQEIQIKDQALETKLKEIETKDKELNVMAETIKLNEPDKIYIDDPQKGKWGGLPKRNDRIITAEISPTTFNSDLYNVKLLVKSTSLDKTLEGVVIFHLHDTFINPVRSVEVINGEAILELISYGAFTVGAECDGGNTKLELDLAMDVPGVSELFKTR